MSHIDYGFEHLDVLSEGAQRLTVVDEVYHPLNAARQQVLLARNQCLAKHLDFNPR